MASSSTSVWESAASPALTLNPDNSVPPRICLASFTLLLQCWNSEQVQVCPQVGPLRGTPKTLEAFHLTQPQSLLVFITRSYGGGISSWHSNPVLEGLVWTGTLCSPRSPLKPTYVSLFLTTIHSCGTSLFQVSASPSTVYVASSVYP